MFKTIYEFLSLFIIPILLTLIGLFLLYRIEISDSTYNPIFYKDLIITGVIVTSYILIIILQYRFNILRSLINIIDNLYVVYSLYLISTLLLIVTAIFGEDINGSNSWIELANNLYIQPIEITKVIMIIFLSYFLSNEYVGIYRNLLLLLFILIPVFITVYFLSDLGGGIILILISLSMIIIVKLDRIFYYSLILLFSLILIFLLFFYNISTYQVNRLNVFLNISNSINKDEGYNIRHVFIGIGNGGIKGNLYNKDTFNLIANYIPSKHTDFIFSIYSLMFGYIGTIALFLLFIIHIIACIKILNKYLKKITFQYNIILGYILYLYTQLFINVSMNIGLLPVVGITMPYLSYGGSSILSFYILLILVFTIYIKNIHQHDSHY